MELEQANEGIKTGFIDLDYKIKGLHKSSLVVIGSRPAMGKTTLALNIATNVAVRSNVPVVIFSLEMSKERMSNIILFSEALVSIDKIGTGKLDKNERTRLAKAEETISKAKIYIDDTPAISINEIKEKCVKFKKEKNIGLIVIDYWQLIQGNTNCNNWEQKNADISLSLKKLAQELDISIIVTSELTRAIEERENKKPVLSDMRSAVVQNSDIVMYLYRDNYYNPDSEKKNIAEIIIAKNRYGNCGTVELLFMEDNMSFKSLARE